MIQKYGPWLLVLLLCACLGWLAPSYRKVVKDNETLTNSVSDLQQRLVTASKTKVSSKTFYPTGKLASETTSETDTNTSEDTNSSSDTSSLTRSHEETTTKRGLFTAIVGVDIDLHPALGSTYQILGPIAIGAGYSGQKPYVGAGLSF